METHDELFSLTTAALTAQLWCNLALDGATTALDAIDASPDSQARATLEHAILIGAKGKWLIRRAIGISWGIAEITGSADDLREGTLLLERAQHLAQQAEQGGVPASELEPLVRENRGTEIVWVDGVPIVPSICPVVVLRGNSFEMGRQYARQIVDIFGDFILRHRAGKAADPEFRAAVEPWERELATYTPWILDFCRGWAAGAVDRGIDMDYWDVVAIWTGSHAPSTTAVGMGMRGGADVRGIPDGPMLEAYLAFDSVGVGGQWSQRPPCSGAAAWGDSSTDGRAVAAASTDHECTFQATIVAYPDDGEPFVYTPFAAAGFIPGLGEFFMAGLPGLNASGVGYVHHGGGFGMTEPVSTWGYGVRRGAEIFDNLRYSGSAAEALERDLRLPVGDAGYPVGFPGGFYVDRTEGWVLEGRAGVSEGAAPVIRRQSRGEDGREHDFLYATNNAISPDSSTAFGATPESFQYSVVEGWHTTIEDDILLDHAPETTARVWTAFSWKRNRYLYEELRRLDGSLSLDHIASLYLNGGPRSYQSSDEQECVAFSAAHRGAAFTVSMDLDALTYRGCVGTIAPGLPAMDGLVSFVYADETHKSWEIVLASTPAELLQAAAAEATRLRGTAGAPSAGSAQRWLSSATADVETAVAPVDEGDVEAIARAVRSALRAQVRLHQVASAPA